jgi:hypothetical protein
MRCPNGKKKEPDATTVDPYVLHLSTKGSRAVVHGEKDAVMRAPPYHEFREMKPVTVISVCVPDQTDFRLSLPELDALRTYRARLIVQGSEV